MFRIQSAKRIAQKVVQHRATFSNLGPSLAVASASSWKAEGKEGWRGNMFFGGVALLTAAASCFYAECEVEEKEHHKHVYNIPAFLKELRSVVREDQLELDLGERRSRGKPWSSYHTIEEFPHVIVLPETTEEVSKVVKLCNKFRIPIVPFGGGTSLEGQILALKGGISLDFNNMKRVVSLNENDLDVTVQAGLGYIELNDYLRPKGLWFPLDPGPGASIGGMCACRCSGSTAVRYGSMRENVLSLTAVLANGDIVTTGTRARKSSAGYDITRLFIGSEGTLAIVTEATLKIHGIPKISRAIRITYPQPDGIHRAASTARDTLNCGVTVGRCELLDKAMVQVLNIANQSQQVVQKAGGVSIALPWKEATTVLYEITGLSEANVAEQAQVVLDIAKKHGGQDFTFFSDVDDCRELWRIRKECIWSSMSVFDDRDLMITDVCVPLSHLPTLITETRKAIDATPLPCQILAHAGDGNFHVLIFFKSGDPNEVKIARQLADQMATRAIEMGGTCTGEHGIGTGKKHLLKKEFSENTIQLMQKIKTTLDPHNLLNPGKVLDWPDNAGATSSPSTTACKHAEKDAAKGCECSRGNH
eukprot:gene3462-3792_t